jgi:CheY-like chemotaxis protein
VVLDLRLPVIDGFTVLEAIKKIDPNVPVVVLSAYGDRLTRERAAEGGAEAFFVKPPDYLKLHSKLLTLIAQRQKFTTLQLSGHQAERLARMRRLMKLKEQAARMGISTPPEILTEIEDLEKELL